MWVFVFVIFAAILFGAFYDTVGPPLIVIAFAAFMAIGYLRDRVKGKVTQSQETVQSPDDLPPSAAKSEAAEVLQCPDVVLPAAPVADEGQLDAPPCHKVPDRPAEYRSFPKCTKRAVPLSSRKTRNALKDYVVLDFETTGLSAWDDEIIEVAAVRYQDGKEVDAYETLVNPLMPIPPRITQLTGISDDDVADAPTMREVFPEMDAFIGEGPIVAHNAKFDVGFLSALYECRYLSREIAYIDTLSLAKKAFPELENHKLATLVKHFRLAPEQTHRALDDVRCTQKVLELCLAQLDKPKAAPRSTWGDGEPPAPQDGYHVNIS